MNIVVKTIVNLTLACMFAAIILNLPNKYVT